MKYENGVICGLDPIEVIKDSFTKKDIRDIKKGFRDKDLSLIIDEKGRISRIGFYEPFGMDDFFDNILYMMEEVFEMKIKYTCFSHFISKQKFVFTDRGLDKHVFIMFMGKRKNIEIKYKDKTRRKFWFNSGTILYISPEKYDEIKEIVIHKNDNHDSVLMIFYTTSPYSKRNFDKRIIDINGEQLIIEVDPLEEFLF